MWAARFGPCTCGSAAACPSPLPRDMSAPEQGPQITLHLMSPISCWFSSCSIPWLCAHQTEVPSPSPMGLVSVCLALTGFQPSSPVLILFLQQIFLTCFSVSEKIGPAQGWAWWGLGWPVLVCGVTFAPPESCTSSAPTPLRHPYPISPVCLSADGGPGAASADVREVLSTRTKRNR